MKSLTHLDGEWQEGNPPVLGPATLATWLGSVIFDGARSFEGTAPDLDRHCQRACASAEKMGMKSPVSAEEIERLAREGIAKFPADTALYIKPLMWAEDGWIYPDPATTRFMLHIFESPLPEPKGFSAHISSRRRAAPDQAPTDAKAACLYPNAGRALREANEAGFDNAIMLDPVGNVAEFATSVTPKDLREADELWSTGNHAKVTPVSRFEDRELQPGPIAARCRELYWGYAKKNAAL
mgnify:CR=1 FL=1